MACSLTVLKYLLGANCTQDLQICRCTDRSFMSNYAINQYHCVHLSGITPLQLQRWYNTDTQGEQSQLHTRYRREPLQKMGYDWASRCNARCTARREKAADCKDQADDHHCSPHFSQSLIIDNSIRHHAKEMKSEKEKIKKEKEERRTKKWSRKTQKQWRRKRTNGKDEYLQGFRGAERCKRTICVNEWSICKMAYESTKISQKYIREVNATALL